MSAILGWCVAGALALCTWWVWRRFNADWRHLEHLLEELAAGRKPESFVFRHGVALPGSRIRWTKSPSSGKS